MSEAPSTREKSENRSSAERSPTSDQYEPNSDNEVVGAIEQVDVDDDDDGEHVTKSCPESVSLSSSPPDHPVRHDPEAKISPEINHNDREIMYTSSDHDSLSEGTELELRRLPNPDVQQPETQQQQQHRPQGPPGAAPNSGPDVPSVFSGHSDQLKQWVQFLGSVSADFRDRLMAYVEDHSETIRTYQRGPSPAHPIGEPRPPPSHLPGPNRLNEPDQYPHVTSYTPRLRRGRELWFRVREVKDRPLSESDADTVDMGVIYPEGGRRSPAEVLAQVANTSPTPALPARPPVAAAAGPSSSGTANQAVHSSQDSIGSAATGSAPVHSLELGSSSPL